MKSLDLIVIGGGTGGLHVARTAKKAGWSVAIVDELPYGGTCALRGCDPKKMLIGATDALDWVRRMGGKGVDVAAARVNWAELMAFKRTFTDAMPPRIERGLDDAGIEVLHGTARFVGPHQLTLDDRPYEARYIHIATGATPRRLGMPGEELVATSTDFLELAELPRRIVFIGGGFISFEFAHIAARAGAAEVTIVQKHPTPLRHFDPDLVALQVKRTRELGIDVHLDYCVDAVESDDGQLVAVCSGPRPERRTPCDMIVHGAGRVANLAGLDLESAGIEYGLAGVKVNRFMRSVSNPTVFAAGDCADTPVPNLTPVSFLEARIAAKNLVAGDDVRAVEYPPIPTAVFTIPPIARVGLLEEGARAEGLDFDVHFKETGAWYSSIRVAEGYSAYKILVERKTGKLLGAHLMGPGAEEQVNLLSMAMKAGLTANQIKSVMFAYPSYASDIASMV